MVPVFWASLPRSRHCPCTNTLNVINRFFFFLFSLRSTFSGTQSLLSSPSALPETSNGTQQLKKLKTSSITSSSFRSPRWWCMVSVSDCLFCLSSFSIFTELLKSRRSLSSRQSASMATLSRPSSSRHWYALSRLTGSSGLQLLTQRSRLASSWSECTGRTSSRIWMESSGGSQYCYSALCSLPCY